MSERAPEQARADLRLAWIVVGTGALLTLTLLALAAHFLLGQLEGWAAQRGRDMQTGYEAGRREQERQRRAIAEAAEPSAQSDEPLPVAAGPAPPDTARPIGAPAQWVDADDYPRTALRMGYEGRVRVTVAVDQAGSPTGCEVRLSSGHWSLDNATCAAMLNNGHFAASPGGPRLRHWTSPAIRWVLPADHVFAKKGG